jgi:hypothetical protein
MADRKQEADVIADLKRVVLENAVVASRLRAYLALCLDKANERYDTAQDWAETCRIQGEKRLIKQMNRVVLKTT